MSRKLVIAGLLLTVIAPCVSAQSGTLYSAQGSGLYQTLSGDAYEGFSGGIGLEGQMRMNFTNGRSLGAGLQFSSHNYAEGFGYDGPLTLIGFFLEPRILLNQNAQRMAPYASLRLALLRQSTTVNGNGVNASGMQINGGGGVLVVANSRTNLDLGATIGGVKFGNYSSTGLAAGSGLNIVFRAGVSVAVGK